MVRVLRHPKAEGSLGHLVWQRRVRDICSYRQHLLSLLSFCPDRKCGYELLNL